MWPDVSPTHALSTQMPLGQTWPQLPQSSGSDVRSAPPHTRPGPASSLPPVVLPPSGSIPPGPPSSPPPPVFASGASSPRGTQCPPTNAKPAAHGSSTIESKQPAHSASTIQTSLFTADLRYAR